MNKYFKAALGGTFDRIHQGHKELLKTAAKYAQKLVIGVTSDNFVAHKHLGRSILPYQVRIVELKEILQTIGISDYELIILEDVYGTTLCDNSIGAIVVSQKTKAGAKMINKKRITRGLKKLPIEIAKMVYDQEGEYISSTRIRQGIINREGKLYLKVNQQTVKITHKQKKILQKPLGKLVTTKNLIKYAKERKNKIAVVGDRCMWEFLSNDIKFDYGVFDNKIMRMAHSYQFNLSLFKKFTALNKPGSISRDAIRAVNKMLKNDKGVLEINGEEDLLVLPLMLRMELGSTIFYGQPHQGLIKLPVTEQQKDQWYNFLFKE